MLESTSKALAAAVAAGTNCYAAAVPPTVAKRCSVATVAVVRPCLLLYLLGVAAIVCSFGGAEAYNTCDVCFASCSEDVAVCDCRSNATCSGAMCYARYDVDKRDDQEYRSIQKGCADYAPIPERSDGDADGGGGQCFVESNDDDTKKIEYCFCNTFKCNAALKFSDEMALLSKSSKQHDCCYLTEADSDPGNWQRQCREYCLGEYCSVDYKEQVKGCIRNGKPLFALDFIPDALGYPMANVSLCMRRVVEEKTISHFCICKPKSDSAEDGRVCNRNPHAEPPRYSRTNRVECNSCSIKLPPELTAQQLRSLSAAELMRNCSLKPRCSGQYCYLKVTTNVIEVEPDLEGYDVEASQYARPDVPRMVDEFAFSAGCIEVQPAHLMRLGCRKEWGASKSSPYEAQCVCGEKNRCNSDSLLQSILPKPDKGRPSPPRPTDKQLLPDLATDVGDGHPKGIDDDDDDGGESSSENSASLARVWTISSIIASLLLSLLFFSYQLT